MRVFGPAVSILALAVGISFVPHETTYKFFVSFTSAIGLIHLVRPELKRIILLISGDISEIKKRGNSSS